MVIRKKEFELKKETKNKKGFRGKKHSSPPIRALGIEIKRPCSVHNRELNVNNKNKLFNYILKILDKKLHNLSILKNRNLKRGISWRVLSSPIRTLVNWGLKREGM